MQKVSFGLTNLKFEITERSNWMPFSGTCCFADVPSDGIPSGGIDKPVAFPAEEIQKALPSMVDMGVNVTYPDDWGDCPEVMFQGHDARFKIGIVKEGKLEGNQFDISGGIWAWDFYDVADMIKNAKDSLGFSVEVLMDDLEDMGDFYNAKGLEFTGVAILWKDRAAFQNTYLAAQRRKDDNSMTKEEMQGMLDAMYTKFSEEVTKVNSQVELLAVEFAKKVEEDNARIAAEFAKKVEEDNARIAAEFAAVEAQKAEEARIAAELAAVEAQKAEEARIAAELEAQKAKEPERQTIQFNVIKRFEGADDAQKEILANKSLSGSSKFRQLIDLKLQSK